MLFDRRQFMRTAGAAIALPFAPHTAKARGYPSQAVRLFVGFPQGGPVDIAARLIAPWLSERLEKSFVVENQSGESGNNATRTVVRSAPDGYTLLICGPVNTINTTLFKELDFSFSRDVAPVASLWRVPLVIEVHPSVEARTLPGLISFARANPGKLKVAFAGNGTPQHIGIELFKMMAGVDLALVPYLGSAPALADLLAGNVHVMFDPLPSSIPHIRAQKLVALAVTTLDRSQALPGVPAAAEVVPGYQAGSWFGIVAPKGTPADVVNLLNREANAALADAQIKARLADLGATAMPGSPGQFGTFIASETESYAGVIRAANIVAK